RVALLREAAPADLARAEFMEALLPLLGLNDEGTSELPPELHAHLGGLRIWQYPIQFGRYVAHLARLGVRSYLEIGLRHGGSFVATAEYLERFSPLAFAVGVDVIDSPSMAEYRRINPKAQFWR